MMLLLAITAVALIVTFVELGLRAHENSDSDSLTTAVVATLAWSALVTPVFF